MMPANTERQRRFQERLDHVKQRAHGNWRSILLNLGLSEAMIVKRRNLPCPSCGGTDRFQFTDAFGEGNYFCRGCGPGGGFKLLQAVMGWDFHTALVKVEQSIGCVETQPPERTSANASQTRMKALMQRLWTEAQPVVTGDAVDTYLRGRGICLPDFPESLRCHPALGYFEKDAKGKSRQVGVYAAMLARIDDPHGEPVSLHRTYLQGAGKAPVPAVKKVLCSGIGGAAVRLFPVASSLGLTEGLENALAVYLATGKPIWAALSAGNLEKIEVPAEVSEVWIYGDNDANAEFDGQASAFALARRLKKEEKRTGHREVRVFLPRKAGTDWADVWRLRNAHALPDALGNQSAC